MYSVPGPCFTQPGGSCHRTADYVGNLLTPHHPCTHKHTRTRTHTHPSPTSDWWSWKSKIHLSLLYPPAGFSMAWLAYHPAPRRSAHVGSLPEPHHPVLSLTYGHTQTLRHSWTDFQAAPAPPAPPPSSYWPVGRGHVAG